MTQRHIKFQEEMASGIEDSPGWFEPWLWPSPWWQQSKVLTQHSGLVWCTTLPNAAAKRLKFLEETWFLRIWPCTVTLIGTLCAWHCGSRWCTLHNITWRVLSGMQHRNLWYATSEYTMSSFLSLLQIKLNWPLITTQQRTRVNYLPYTEKTLLLQTNNRLIPRDSNFLCTLPKRIYNLHV